MTLILVADGARARLFRLERPDALDADSSSKLVEVEDLVNPEQELSGKEMFENLKSGRNRAPSGGPAHGYDDHRGDQRREHERRLAKRAVDSIAKRAREEAHPRLVVVADPRMLGLLRKQIEQANLSIKIDELTAELSSSTPKQLHERLVTAGLLSGGQQARMRA